MEHQEKVSSNASDRKKELLQKLYRRKNPLSTSIPAQPQPSLSGIRRREIGQQEESGAEETDNASVSEVRTGGEGLQPDLSDLEATLKRSCASHLEKETNETKYFCNDCKMFICIYCIAFGVHNLHQVLNEEDSRAIMQQMIAEKRKEQRVKELQRILEEQRGEHIEHFETLLMETTNHIRLLQEKSLDSWDTRIRALVGNTKDSNDVELSKLLQLGKTYASQKGSIQYSQDENSLVIVLPRNPFHEEDPQTDMNAYYPMAKIVKKGVDVNENHKLVNIPCSPVASSTPSASIIESENEKHKSSEVSQEESAQILFVESPDKIFIRRKSREGDWEEMKSWIEGEASTARPVIPKKGQTLLCRVGPSNWYRCVVKTVQDSLFKVKLIDVGKAVVVNLRDIRDISRKLKAKESLIDCIKLDVESPGPSWPATTLENLREFLPEGEEVFVKDLEDGSRDLLKTTLTEDNPFDPPTLSRKSVLSFLADNGMALKRGTLLRTQFSSRLSANLRADLIDHNNKRLVISPETITTDEEVDHDPRRCFKVDILPIIPRQQVFEAVMTHIDDKAVVWVMLQDDVSKLKKVTADCLKCIVKETTIEVGCLYVARQGKNRVRVRVLKCLEDGKFYCVNVDSGETLHCDGDILYKASPPILHVPPLAVPLKLYGVKKAVGNIGEYIHEELTGPQLGLVTVVVLEENVTALPLPAHVFYAKNGSKCGGNLAFTMLRRGLVRVITSYADWSLEFNDHGLEWLLGMSPKLHDLYVLPFPLPLASGTWLSVLVEGLEYLLKDGEEVEPTIHYKEANKVGCRVLPTNHLLNFGQDARLQMEIGDSMRISESQVTEISNAFLRLIKKLQKSGEVASPVQSLTRGQPVLAYYSFGAGSDGEWCRAILTLEPCQRDDYVWVSFTDYGHRAMVPRSVIRVLDESLRREPVYLLSVSFKMPNENCQLRTIRREIKDRDDETLILLKVTSTLPKNNPHVREMFVEFAKAVQDIGKKGSYSIANIC